ncbi:uncharacterized protein ACRADG_004743 [Cochliomyia hominivorax]
MVSNKMFAAILVLFLIQSTFAKPVENNSKSAESSEEKDVSAKDSLTLYTAVQFLAIATKYAEQSANISRDIIKDEELLANEKPEVIEFKKNITKFVESYDSAKDADKALESIELFSNTTDHYYELPEDKQTPESEFIVKILNKYKVKDLETDVLKQFDEFLVNFKSLFEKAKGELKKPLLDWYDNFLTITDFEKKFEAFNEFADLV